jgi:hypothetical protein
MKTLLSVLPVLLVVAWACDPPPPPEARDSPWDAPAEVEAEILTVVQQLFDVLEHRDVELGRRILAPGGRFVSIRETDDGTVFQDQSHEEFLASIGGEGPGLLERFWDPVVLVRGDLAVVWTPYDFWIDGARSHCGVDAFTLARAGGTWRIEGIAYTVEFTGCDEPPLRTPLTPPDWTR